MNRQLLKHTFTTSICPTLSSDEDEHQNPISIRAESEMVFENNDEVDSVHLYNAYWV